MYKTYLRSKYNGAQSDVKQPLRIRKLIHQMQISYALLISLFSLSFEGVYHKCDMLILRNKTKAIHERLVSVS